MARWNMRARVVDLGTSEMGSDFIIHNGVKVIMPNGERRFLGRVIMHNEVESLFRERQAETVQLYLSGRGEGRLALLYGMKTDDEHGWNGQSPFSGAKLVLLACVPVLLALCLLLIGISMLAVCLWYRWHLSRWDPPSRKVFEGHVPEADEAGFGPTPVAFSIERQPNRTSSMSLVRHCTMVIATFGSSLSECDRRLPEGRDLADFHRPLLP